MGGNCPFCSPHPEDYDGEPLVMPKARIAMPDAPLILLDTPRPAVRRITLNRPDKRNALSNELRAALFEALEAADRDSSIRVTILRGAGPCFSAGYDLSREGAGQSLPFHTAAGAGQWARHPRW